MDFNFEYFCNKCGKKNVQDIGFICECGGEYKLDKSLNLLEPLTPYWSENLGRYPVLVESRSHRKQLMRERKLEIMPYKKNPYEGYRPVVNGHKMTEHQYAVAQKKGFNPI